MNMFARVVSRQHVSQADLLPNVQPAHGAIVKRGPFGLCVRTVDNVPKAGERLGYDQFHHRPVRQLPLLDRKQILAIAAVTDVAINSRDGLVLASDIASRLKLPTRHLEKVLQALTRQRILLSKPGFGYGLAREPHRINAADILRAL